MNADDAGGADPGYSAGGGTDVGDRMYDYHGVDQFGETVRLHDFAGLGAPVVLHIDAMWDPQAENLADVLAGRSSSLDSEFDSAALRAALDSEQLYWVTVFGWGRSLGVEATTAELDDWLAEHGNSHLPHLIDKSGGELMDFLGAVAVPTIIGLDEDMVILHAADTNFADNIDAMVP